MCDRKRDSYWTKRRRIRAAVHAHVADMANDANCAEPFNVNANDLRSDSLHYSPPFCDSLHDLMQETDTHNFSVDEVRPIDDPVEELDRWSDCSNYHDDSHNTDSDTDSYIVSDEFLKDELSIWATDFHISSKAVGALLDILRPYHPSLPKDGRTVTRAGSSNAVCVASLAGGLYYHFGIENCLKQLHSNGMLSVEDGVDDLYISIQINIDGLPLFKSSTMQLWPILGMIKEPPLHPCEPFVIGVFGGMTKPKSLGEYLHNFVLEAKKLHDEGLLLSGRKVFLSLHSFVCDAPARAFLKNVKSFNGYHGCERCTQNGVYVKGRMTFPHTSSTLRTDHSFTAMLDEDHHLSDVPSPLVELPLGMVTCFALDYMHLVCLGVVRRLVLLWLRGPLPTRLPAQAVADISTRLLSLRPRTPCEFARKPRSLTDIDRWKATEYRQFLLFTGPVVLKDILPDQLYNNFLLLHVAMKCLLSPHLCGHYADFAEKLLKQFVAHSNDVYGPEFSVYNVHNLVHLADDARHFGPLDNVSCFPFENLLGQLKKLVRSPHLPLQQVINRICEQQSCTAKRPCKPQTVFPYLKRAMNTDFHVPNCEDAVFYSCLQTEACTLKLKDSDNCVLLLDDKIGQIQYMFLHSEKIHVVVKLFKGTESFYCYPIKSELINVVRVRNLSNKCNIYMVADIKTKCFCMPLQDGSCIAVPL